MFKKQILTFVLCVLLAGCVNQNGQYMLFNKYRLFGTTPETIKVEKGDTLYSIAKRYDISISELIETNHIDSPDQLYVGQVLKTSQIRYHTVKKGETLFSVARKNHTTVEALAQNNHLSAPYHLNVGQRLAVNGKASEQTHNVTKKYTQTKNYSTTYVAPKNRTSKFLWPVQGKVVSNFGATGKGRKNDGINISAPLGSCVKAADKGVVAYAGNELKGFGNLILIKHPDGFITAYAHTDKILVKKGQNVTRGMQIATVGKTGGVNTPQLHFEVRLGKKAVNPKIYLP